MLPNPDWNEIFIQGLVGLGLVGYNTVKTLVDRFDAKTLMDYAEFYPSLSLIENGEIINQCARVHVMDLASRRFYLLHGPQPRSDEVGSLFLQKFIQDFKVWNQETPIDLYISFGAFVTKLISTESLTAEEQEKSPEEMADIILQYELEKSRNLFIATTGGLKFEQFSQDVHPNDVMVRETQSYISGLNGVLPAMIGERLGIHTATIMVETTGVEPTRTNINPALAQLLGLLATRKGLQFLDRLFDMGLDLENRVADIIDQLLPAARKDLITTLQNGDLSDNKKKDSDKDRTMYV